MKIRSILVALFLSHLAFDQNLFRKTENGLPRTAELALGEDRIRKRRRHVLPHRGPIPPWVRGPEPLVRMKVNHFNPKSRDPRDSNQRAIRRKFSNI